MRDKYSTINESSSSGDECELTSFIHVFGNLQLNLQEVTAKLTFLLISAPLSRRASRVST